MGMFIAGVLFLIFFLVAIAIVGSGIAISIWIAKTSLHLAWKLFLAALSIIFVVGLMLAFIFLIVVFLGIFFVPF